MHPPITTQLLTTPIDPPCRRAPADDDHPSLQCLPYAGRRLDTMCVVESAPLPAAPLARAHRTLQRQRAHVRTSLYTPRWACCCAPEPACLHAGGMHGAFPSPCIAAPCRAATSVWARTSTGAACASPVPHPYYLVYPIVNACVCACARAAGLAAASAADARRLRARLRKRAGDHCGASGAAGWRRASGELAAAAATPASLVPHPPRLHRSHSPPLPRRAITRHLWTSACILLLCTLHCLQTNVPALADRISSNSCSKLQHNAQMNKRLSWTSNEACPAIRPPCDTIAMTSSPHHLP